MYQDWLKLILTQSIKSVHPCLAKNSYQIFKMATESDSLPMVSSLKENEKTQIIFTIKLSIKEFNFSEIKFAQKSLMNQLHCLKMDSYSFN